MKIMLTSRELDALSAWWSTGTVVAAARLLGVTEQTAKNQLYMARIRAGVSSNAELARMHLKVLRSADLLVAQRRSA